MKPSVTVVALLFAGWTCHEAMAELSKLDFDRYDGYFVSNQFEPDAAESFVVIEDQKQFDKVFGVAMVMNDKSHRLPKNTFASNLVLAVVKRGNQVLEYRAKKVTVADGVVQFHYSSKAGDPSTATFASPLIVSIPKGKYTAVEFIENKKSLKTIKLGQSVDR